MIDVIKSSEYRDWLRDLKQQIKTGQVKADTTRLYNRHAEPITRHSALDAESPVNNEIAGQARNDGGQKRCSKGQVRNDEGVLNLIQYRNDESHIRNDEGQTRNLLNDMQSYQNWRNVA